MRILCIEDNPGNQKVIATMLKQLDAEIVMVSSSKEGLILLLDPHEVFDVALIDVGMPEMSGVEIVKAVRAHPDPRVNQAKLFALTAHAAVDDRDEAIAAGFDAYILKPINPRTFTSTIEKLLRDSDTSNAEAPF